MDGHPSKYDDANKVSSERFQEEAGRQASRSDEVIGSKKHRTAQGPPEPVCLCRLQENGKSINTRRTLSPFSFSSHVRVGSYTRE